MLYTDGEMGIFIWSYLVLWQEKKDLQHNLKSFLQDICDSAQKQNNSKNENFNIESHPQSPSPIPNPISRNVQVGVRIQGLAQVADHVHHLTQSFASKLGITSQPSILFCQPLLQVRTKRVKDRHSIVPKLHQTTKSKTRQSVTALATLWLAHQHHSLTASPVI